MEESYSDMYRKNMVYCDLCGRRVRVNNKQFLHHGKYGVIVGKLIDEDDGLEFLIVQYDIPYYGDTIEDLGAWTFNDLEFL